MYSVHLPPQSPLFRLQYLRVAGKAASFIALPPSFLYSLDCLRVQEKKVDWETGLAKWAEGEG